jgi:hypothetical protein
MKARISLNILHPQHNHYDHYVVAECNGQAYVPAEDAARLHRRLMMFVQIELKSGIRREWSGPIADAVEQAIADSTKQKHRRCFVQTNFDKGTASVGDAKGDRRIAIVIQTGERFSDRAKRDLFGRIMDRLERDFDISCSEVLIGVIETPVANWSTGYTEHQWLETMAYQLP